jgi:acid phosphatase
MAGLAVLTALAGGVASRLPSATAQSATPSAPCIGSPAPTTYGHVIVIVEENKALSTVQKAPYQTSLARACGLASGMYAETYPSLPNYMAMTGGTVPSAIAARDCVPGGSCLSAGNSIFGQTPSWKVYAESMPSNCSNQNTANGLYVPRHTAAPYYTKLAGCTTKQVPLGSTTSGAFESDLRAGSLPEFALVAPNTTNDAHGGCLACADMWLQTWMPKIVASPAYQNGSTAVFVTYDSDNKSSGNHIYTAVVAPSVAPGTVVSTRLSHYAMLRTIEDMLALPHLGNAATAPGMRAAFHL